MIKLNNWANICKFHNSILFRHKYTKHFWKSEIIIKNHFWKSESSVLFLHLLLEELHGIGLGLRGGMPLERAKQMKVRRPDLYSPRVGRRKTGYRGPL